MGDTPPENDTWQSEIASRLDTYRSRNKRKLSGDFSMRFDFDGEPAAPRQQVCVPFSAEMETEDLDAAAPEAEQQVVEGHTGLEQAELPQEQPPAQQPLRPSVPFKRKVVMDANVIEFPRLF